MKTVLSQYQCGYLVKDGVYQRLLQAGKHRYPAWRGYRILVCDLQAQVDCQGIPANVLLKDPAFADAVTRIQVPDDAIALRYKDGRFDGLILGGEQLYWNTLHQYTFTLLNLSSPDVEDSVPRHIFSSVPKQLYERFEVHSGEVGLLHFDNRLERQLGPGIYYFWNWRTKVACEIVDLKTQLLELNGQEVLTADKVGIRLNLVCSYQVTDPATLVATVKNLTNQLHALFQLLMREYVGRYRLDELLDQKEKVSSYILQRAKEVEKDYCVCFLTAGIKDIILPGEIRNIMNTVLVAEKTAQANVITRREEVASTRSLLNTAKLMDENKTLYRLKELEYIERICDRVDNISLSGADGILEQLGKLLGSPGVGQ